MNLTESQKKFLDKLDKTTYYKVDNKNYTHALPSEMSVVDINKLMEDKQAGLDINEGSVKFNGQLLL